MHRFSIMLFVLLLVFALISCDDNTAINKQSKASEDGVIFKTDFSGNSWYKLSNDFWDDGISPGGSLKVINDVCVINHNSSPAMLFNISKNSRQKPVFGIKAGDEIEFSFKVVESADETLAVDFGFINPDQTFNPVEVINKRVNTGNSMNFTVKAELDNSVLVSWDSDGNGIIDSGEVKMIREPSEKLPAICIIWRLPYDNDASEIKIDDFCVLKAKH